MHLICYNSKKPTKSYLKMTIASTNDRIITLGPFVPNHIYKALEEC
jgi:hypothetical protein